MSDQFVYDQAHSVLQDKVPRRRWSVPGLIGALIVSALAGAAILMQIRGWSALGTEAGGACGGLYGACPPGETPILVSSLVGAIFTVPVAVALFFRRPRVVFALVGVLGLVGGAFAGQAIFDEVHGASLSTSWTAPFDPPNNLATQGVWVASESVIRIRTDEVVSYSSTTGAAQWTFSIPGNDVVCAVSRTTAGRVGVLGYGEQDAPCGHLVALDLATGRRLWATDIPTDGQEPPPATDLVAAAGGLVLARTADQIVAFDANTGTRRWTRNVADGCQEQFVAADPGTVVAIATCDSGYLVSDLDPATGNPRWATPIAEQQSSYQLSLLSVRPVVVSDVLPGQRTTDDIRVFTAQGRQDVTIPVTNINSPDGPVALNTAPQGGSGFGPQPLWWTVVAGGSLVGVTRDVNGHDDAIAFSLATGRQEWLTALPNDVDAVAVHGNGLVVIDESPPALQVQSISLANGAASEIGVLGSSPFGNGDVGLYPVGGRYVAVNELGVNPVPPVFSFR